MITSISALILSVASLALLPYKLGQLTLKVNTLWEAWMHDAISEGAKSGLIKRKSQIDADSDKVELFLEGLITTFRSDKDLDCNDMMKRIGKLERKYGELLLQLALKYDLSYKGLLVTTAMLLNKK